MVINRQKRQIVFSKVIALVIMQAVILSGSQSAYCGESLRPKTANLSPHINVSAVELQQAFNISLAVLSDTGKLDKTMSRRRFLGLSAIVAVALVVSPSLVTETMAGKLSKEERKRFEEIRNKLRQSEAVKEAPASYKPSKVDQEKDAMWKRIDSQMKLSSEDAYKNVERFFTKERIVIYRKLAKLLQSTGMPVEVIMALDLAETDLRDKVKSDPGARGPMQVMPGTIEIINKQLAEWKKQGDKKGKYRQEYLTAVELIGSRQIDWKRVNEPEYGRRVGITVAYLSYTNLARIFESKGLVYDSKSSNWQFVPTSNNVKPYIYFSTAVLNAAYNGRGEGMVLKMIKKYGPIPLKVFEVRRLTPKEQEQKYFDPNQKIGWLEGDDRGEYKDETRKHFLRLWRYHTAIQEFKSSNANTWVKIIPNKKFAFNQIGTRLVAAFASVQAFSSVNLEQKIDSVQVIDIDRSI
ncbi:MAG: twin-arginine translocation signal domain-containing protein [Candidatus Omnitrophota bacterium]